MATIFQMYSGITHGRVLNGAQYAQRFQKFTVFFSNNRGEIFKK